MGVDEEGREEEGMDGRDRGKRKGWKEWKMR